MIEGLICWGCFIYFVFFDHDPSWLIACGIFAIATNVDHLKDKDD